MLAEQQQLMFDIGAVLAMGGDFDTPTVGEGLGTLTSAIEALNDRLPPLKEFVIPGAIWRSARSHVPYDLPPGGNRPLGSD